MNERLKALGFRFTLFGMRYLWSALHLLGSALLDQGISQALAYDDLYIQDQDVAVVANDIIRDARSSTIGIPVSPSCWASAIALLGSPGSDATTFCAALPESSQKRLALELARCHLEDTQKPLFRNHLVTRDCGKTAPTSDNFLRKCLSDLTEPGEHAYSHYIPYLQALCTRKTQELFLQHQQSTKDRLASEYAKMSRASIEHMETLHQTTAQQAEELSAKLADISSVIQSQIAEQLGDIIQKELSDRLAEAIHQQTSIQSRVFKEILSSIELQDSERKQQQEEWTHYQSGMLLKQAKDMEKNRDALRESQAKIEDLTSKVERTTSHMQPLVGLQEFMKAATEGYSWISFLLHFLATFNIVWVVTRPERCHQFRSYIFAVVVAEAAIELGLKCLVANGLIDNGEVVGLTGEVRRLSILLECIAYLVGMAMTCFFSSHKEDEESEELLNSLVRRHIQELAPNPRYYEHEDLDRDYTTPRQTTRTPGIPPLTLGEYPLHRGSMHSLQASGTIRSRSRSMLRSHQANERANQSHRRVVEPSVSSPAKCSPHSPHTFQQVLLVSPRRPAVQQTRRDTNEFMETIDEPPSEPSVLQHDCTPRRKRSSSLSLLSEPNTKRIHFDESSANRT